PSICTHFVSAFTLPYLYHHILLLAHIYFHRSFFFFTDPPTTDIYTLSLHDALPISRRFRRASCARWPRSKSSPSFTPSRCAEATDRKSTRLNSSHQIISYAVFCLKKKKKNKKK